EQLYPKEHYPQGHPHLATSLNNLGFVLKAQGEYAQALGYYQRGLEMAESLLDVFLGAVSESEALNRLAALPFSRDGYLTVAQRFPKASDAAYGHVWHSKGAVARIQARRQWLLQTDPQTGKLALQLAGVRQQLARLLLAPADTRQQQSVDLVKLAA